MKLKRDKGGKQRYQKPRLRSSRRKFNRRAIREEVDEG